MLEERDTGKLRRWCVRKHEHGWSVASIASHAQVPSRTVYSWLEKQRRYGSVKDRNRGQTKTNGRHNARALFRLEALDHCIMIVRDTGQDDALRTHRVRHLNLNCFVSHRLELSVQKDMEYVWHQKSDPSVKVRAWFSGYATTGGA